MPCEKNDQRVPSSVPSNENLLMREVFGFDFPSLSASAAANHVFHLTLFINSRYRSRYAKQRTSQTSPIAAVEI